MVEQKPISYILVMPSSHLIAKRFAIRVARKSGAVLIDDFFLKETVGNIVDNFDFSKVSFSHIRDVKRTLSRLEKIHPQKEISLKNVNNKVRCYFPPVTYNDSYRGDMPDGNIILIDDLLSTGTTLLSARDILIDKGIDCTSAFCLLSQLGTRMYSS